VSAGGVDEQVPDRPVGDVVGSGDAVGSAEGDDAGVGDGLGACVATDAFDGEGGGGATLRSAWSLEPTSAMAAAMSRSASSPATSTSR
jgi:hypothetical protein